MLNKRLAFAVFFLLIPFVLSAQDLSVTNLSELTFGDNIFPGSSKDISREEAAAAAFEISGESGQEVHVTFELPAELISEELKAMEISFSSTDAGYHIDETGQDNSTAFDPENGLIITLSTEGMLYIWLGGTVFPYNNQPGGFYSADINANVSYTTQ